jgi:tRNA1Val (adenine37-N6)-methyltransferase
MNKEFGPRRDETLDVLTCCPVSVLQKKKGYRYSLEAYLLGAFVEESPGTEVIEIGSGSGVVAILLATVKGLRVTGVEIQEDIAEMSVRSIAQAGLSDRISIHCCDIRDYSGPRVQAVVTNPPYRPLETGRINPDRSKAIARHEIMLDLDDLLRKTHELLVPHGRFYIVYPAWRLPDLIYAMRARRIEPKRMRCAFTSPSRTSEICLVCGVRGGGREFAIESPFIIFQEDGAYHRDMDTVLQGLALPKKQLT